MAENKIDLDTLEENIINENKVEQRIKDLSNKVKLTSQERDELSKAKELLENEKEAVSKERDFYKGFNATISKYPNAGEHQEEILNKVKSGYDIEDATISVLAKVGKFTTPPPPRESPVGGSAVNSLPSSGTKNIAEMTREEKRSALLDAEKRGDLGVN